MTATIMTSNVRVPMRDGVALAADLYLPASGKPCPVVLYRTPYGKHWAAQFVGGGFATHHEALVAHGYAVVVQDVRGRYASEGEFDLFNPGETDDGVDTIAWITAQPWCNGRIGMSGTSYLAVMQFMAAIGNPPGLTTIMPSLGAQIATHLAPGVPSMEMAVALAIWLLFDYCERKAVEIAEPELRAIVAAQRENWTLIASLPALLGSGRADTMEKLLEIQGRMLAIKQSVTNYCTREPLSARFAEVLKYAPWLGHLKDELEGDVRYFTKMDYRSRLDQVNVPVLHTVGWYEAFLPGALEQFSLLRSREDAPFCKFVIAPVTHFNAPGLPLGEKSVPVQYPGFTLFPPVLPSPQDGGDFATRWMAHWLKGEDTGLDKEAPITLYVMGENVWRDEYEWPLARTVWTPMFLASGGAANTARGDGRLLRQQEKGAACDRYRYDPAHPIRTIDGTNLGIMDVPNGMHNQAPLENRDDVLFYTSARLDEDLEITGPVTLKLWFASTAVDTDFHAKLVDVEADNAAYNVCAGVVRLRAVPLAARAAGAGGAREISIDLAPTSFVFKAGHRIRLQLTSSNFPDMDVNLNTGKSSLVSDEAIVAQHTVFHDRERPTRLVLPVIPRK